jgi:peptidoglycan hydrolase-like protein with peptidoglycan-binding domain
MALVVPASASAQLPTPPSQPTPPAQPPAAQPVKPGLSVALKSGLRSGGTTYVISHELITVAGHINKAAAGEHVVVELWRNGKRHAHRNAKVKKNGTFSTKLRPGPAARYRIRAVHKKSAKVQKGQSKRVAFSAIRGSAHAGSGGPKVRLLQKELAALGYAVPRTGRFDDGTARAVLAYRKVNRMSRTSRANRTIFNRLFEGKGTFKLKYPNAGKHVEADLSRQVLVLADNGKPYRIYHTSSGKPSTPTVTGSYRFYSKTPGYNSHEMYYSSYFIRGYAIHGYKSVPTFNASHGCLRVPLASAVAIYNWISLGDRIFVYR